jgi:hypothetical protein
MISQYFFEKNMVLVDYIGIFFLHCTFLLIARILPTEYHIASKEGKNGYATYQGMYEHNLYSRAYEYDPTIRCVRDVQLVQ